MTILQECEYLPMEKRRHFVRLIDRGMLLTTTVGFFLCFNFDILLTVSMLIIILMIFGKGCGH